MPYIIIKITTIVAITLFFTGCVFVENIKYNFIEGEVPERETIALANNALTLRDKQIIIESIIGSECFSIDRYINHRDYKTGHITKGTVQLSECFKATRDGYEINYTSSGVDSISKKYAIRSYNYKSLGLDVEDAKIKIKNFYPQASKKYMPFKEKFTETLDNYPFRKEVVIKTSITLPSSVLINIKKNMKYISTSIKDVDISFTKFVNQNLSYENWIKKQVAITYVKYPSINSLNDKYFLVGKKGKETINFNDKTKPITVHINSVQYNYGYEPLMLEDENLKVIAFLDFSIESVNLKNIGSIGGTNLNIEFINHAKKMLHVKSITLYYGENVYRDENINLKMSPMSKKSFAALKNFNKLNAAIDINKHKAYNFGFAIEYYDSSTDKIKTIYKLENRKYKEN